MPTMMNTQNGAGGKKKKKKKKKKRSSPELAQQMASVKAALDKAPLDVKTLSNRCLLLSKVLDSLVELDRKPIYRHDLLPLIQQVCKHKEKAEVRPSLMVLLLSIKSAFRAGWLPKLEVSGNEEIFSTLNLLFDSFTTISEDVVQGPLQCGGSAVTEPLEAMNFLIFISDRFYPRLQLNAIFVAVPAKVGYEVLMCDFHVPHMNIDDRVRLYVINTDSTETSTCLITPPQVNILVNGRHVEKRVITGYVDAGPQMPSDVNHLVKVGANVLQVIGEFSGPYIIAVASSSTTIERTPNNTQLEDYVASANTEVNPTTEPDDDMVELGASRLSLRCPISHQRLVTPVKATTCRHLQCFEYDSFLEINEKRPSWRCPCCNCFTNWPDLRIDRKMEKILKETDESIHEVIISQDGSWAPVPTDETHTSDVEDVIDVARVAGDQEFRETKPDKQTLLEIRENIPDITATGPPNMQGFAGPSWGGSTGSGVNFTGGNSTSFQGHSSRAGFHLNSLVGGHRTYVRTESIPTQQQAGPPHQQLATQIQGLQLSPQGTSFSEIPVPHQSPTLQEQNSWRPGAIRMRGSIANPSANPLHQRCAFNTGPNYSDSDANAA